MPTYEFRCPRGHEFEKLYRTISGAEAQAACPVCGELADRMMSAAGFSFKGSGFYLTDYGKNAHREKGGSSKPATESGSSGSGPASDTKSEGTKPEGAKGAGSEGGGASSASAAPAAAADAKPAAPKKSSGE